jgi:pyridoxal phosphate enzyme (YggS family)
MIKMEKDLVTSIRNRYQHVMGQISDACMRVGNTKVQLVVVSKSQPFEVVQAAVAAGVTALGENYADEAVKKIFALHQSAVEWHMIGHVQSRKAELVAEHFAMLHSLDSLKLANRLERFCTENDRSLPVLLEVNISGEESKYGFPAWDEAKWSDLLPDLDAIAHFPHFHLCGLMTMPPFFENPELTRPYFRQMRHLRDYLAKQLPHTDWSELSMGTSIDFLTAIEEGATFVRIGQAILGPRPIQKV